MNSDLKVILVIGTVILLLMLCVPFLRALITTIFGKVLMPLISAMGKVTGTWGLWTVKKISSAYRLWIKNSLSPRSVIFQTLEDPKEEKKEDTLRTFTEEDFEEGGERISFMMVRANILALFDKKRKPAELLKAAEWVFGRPDTPFTFERCCANLGTRKDVLRLRIHYEFWRTWYVLPIEFPFLIEPLPPIVADEIYMLCGDEGIDLARAAWMKPGIRAVELLQIASGVEKAPDSYIRALELLGNKYFMSQQGDYWYLTGRNPIVRGHDLETSAYKRAIHNVSWSRMF